MAERLRLDAEDRILTVEDTPGFVFMYPRAALLGQHYADAIHPFMVEHWQTALRQCRALRVTVPISYEWEHETGWIVRAVYFTPSTRGCVLVELVHLGTLPLEEVTP